MALIEKLTNIADAIRAKTGKTDQMTLDAMVDEIGAIETGGGELPDEAFNYSGDLSHLFRGGKMDWFIYNCGKKTKTEDITLAEYMFSSTKIETIPFELNFKTGIKANVGYLFSGSHIKEIPKINNLKIGNYDGIFANCAHIKEFPEDLAEWIDWSYIDNATGGYDYLHSYLIRGCSSLRKLPIEFLKHYNKNITSTSGTLYGNFYQLSTLDEAVNIPVGYTKQFTSNIFSNFGALCSRVKNITFETDNGTPYEKQWKNQYLNLTGYIGYGGSDAFIVDNKESGITEDKKVKDDASYQALKNDEDWYTIKYQYSRYNHDSAVATINSLPDTSAYLAANGGTNTLKFSGSSGSLTDGGAINTLTEEEIAVATAKGWTVSFI